MNLSHNSNSSRHLTVQKRARHSDKDPDLVASNEYEGEAFSDPPNHFVLCGRGERTNRHAGNKTFRRLVEINRSLYHSSDKQKKSIIATSIVQAIYCQDRPGRFVREDKQSGLWIDVGMKQSIKKTSQALREKAPKKTSSSRQDFSSAPPATKEDEDEDTDTDTDSEVDDEEEEDEYSSEEYAEVESSEHVVVNVDLITNNLSNDFHPAHDMTGVPPPPALTFEVPPPPALTFEASDWTFKSLDSTHEVPEGLVPPTLDFQTSDCTLKSISSIFSDGAHSVTNDEGKAVFHA